MEFVKSVDLGSNTNCHFHKTRLGEQWKSFNLFIQMSGPMRTQSLNGGMYYVAFIDDFSKMCWIYFLKQKSKVPHVVWKFKN